MGDFLLDDAGLRSTDNCILSLCSMELLVELFRSRFIGGVSRTLLELFEVVRTRFLALAPRRVLFSELAAVTID